jgi:cell division protease FtsH
VTTGAENDLQRVTMIARQMVTRWGMSPRLGTISFSERQSPFSGGGDTGAPSDYSEETAEIIDDEVQRLVREGYAKSIDLLTTHRATLDRIAQALHTHETIDAKQLATILEETDVHVSKDKLEPAPAAPGVIAPPPPPMEPPAAQPPEIQ